MLLPVIIAGGSGSRLWPLSRTLYPKQFLMLNSELTMLQETITRLDGIEHQAPFIICNEEHRFIIAEQLRQQQLKNSGIVLEPIGKNTAPAIAIAALQAISQGEDPILLILAADHIIQNHSAFIEAIKQAKPLAEKGKLVTFGVVPTSPETGYGYIKIGDSIANNAYYVNSFIEKPDVHKANRYLQDNSYFWNSGMFMFRASQYLRELKQYRPDILSTCALALDNAHVDLDFIRLDHVTFATCPDLSIDYAVMEKTKEAVVVTMDAEWNDVGSWASLWKISKKDKQGNVIRGDVLIKDTNSSYIYSQNKLVATVGIDNLVIIETKDAILVSHKDKVNDVKDIVSQLKQAERCEYLQHKEVYRPWGFHDAISEGERYHVKKVTIKPGQRTATQIHHHRAEHWIVVSGTAKVHNGDKTYLVTENESTYISVGSPHSIENPRSIPLIIIEVRTGSYLGDDDITRLDNKFEGY